MKIHSKIARFNADTFSPVGVYMSLRDYYRKPCLLESNAYNDRSNSKSLIGLDPLVEIVLRDNVFQIIEFGNTRAVKVDKTDFSKQLQDLIANYEFTSPHFSNGFFAYTGFELSRYKETHLPDPNKQLNLPDLQLILYRFMLVLDHYNDEGQLIENSIGDFSDNFDSIPRKINFRGYTALPFSLIGEESCSTSSEEFLTQIDRAQQHCERGDVFQLVLSRRFEQRFVGEDFEVYRQLRRTNPSPYLFYFDFESHRLMGSSPEAQLVVSNGTAEIHPIAGTVKRTGNTIEDQKRIEFLIHDEKENAEHTMLVDLARNDLSKHCTNVRVERYKEVQQFSHVTHLVSNVQGDLNPRQSLDVYLDTFPAGTLSGTPKPKALALISAYEPHAREFYGGGIGFINVHGDLNMAIIIRSVLSQNNTLYYQAGAGIVLDSIRESELQEVDNKLNAVRTAIRKCDAATGATLNAKIESHETSRY
jgi:anthranilate synthase component I